MGCKNGENLLTTIKLLDIETGNLTSESLDCLFDDNDTSCFLNWLCSNVNENNILTDSELYEFDILQNENKVIAADTIEDIVLKTDRTHSGIFDVNTSEINSLKKEIECIQNKEDNCNSIICKYLDLDKKFAHQLTKLDEEEVDVKIKRQSILTECEVKCRKIDELHGKIFTNVKLYLDLLPMYKTIQHKYFMFQMSMNNFKQECDSYNSNLNMWIEKEFESNNILNTSFNNNNSFLDSELSRMKFVIEESVSKYVKAQCAEKELSSRLMYLRTNNNKHIIYSEEEQRIKEIQITSRVNSLSDDLDILYSTKLQKITENFTQNLINEVLVANAQIKLDTCKDTMKKLTFLDEEVKNSLAQYMLMFVLLKIDKTMIQLINKFLEDTYFYSAMYHEQYTLKSELVNKQGKIAIENTFLNDILILLSDKYNARKISLEDVQNEITSRKVNIQNLENSLFILENQKYWDTINIAQKDLQKAKHFLYCGPTLQPIIIPYEWLESLDNTNVTLTNVDKKLRSTLEKYKQIMNMLDKNRWLKFKRLLWAWYLIKPEMVVRVVNQIQDFLVEQVKNDN